MSGRDDNGARAGAPAPRPPDPPQVPEVPLVLGAALLAAGALTAQAVLRFGAGWADWPGLAAAALALLFVAAAVLAAAPRGWRWVGATVCLHLGLHPAFAVAAAGAPLAVLAAALAALGAWAALANLGADRGARAPARRRSAALFLGLLSGFAALVRPDLLALVLPLGALALALVPAPREARRPALGAFTVAALAAIPLGLLLRGQVLDLDFALRWPAGAPAALADFVRVNAVTLTAGLSGLALLGLRVWRTAALLYGPLPPFAGAALFLAPALPTPLAALHLPLLPLLPLLAVAFAVLLARALDALPTLRPADDLGRSAALLLGLVYILHLLALDLGTAPPPIGLPV